MSKSLRRTIMAGVAAGAALLPGMAVAQNAQPAACAERASLVQSLSNNYAEQPTSMGLAANGAVFEIFTSETGSWTILVTRPDGVSCLMATGENWETLPQLAQGPEI
jgi:hypothetical protein